MHIGHDLLLSRNVSSAQDERSFSARSEDNQTAGAPARPANVVDRELLREFIRSRDQGAFQQIVMRHGALVLGVATRVLRDRHQAEDVFQATFLVLARKASSVRRQTSLASWLHGVARRIALRSLQQRYRRGEESLHTEPTMEASPLESVGSQWEQQILDEELQLLPETWREPLILHELEGLSCQETADRLGLTLTALEGRLKRGRKELKHRLLRRGIGVGAVLMGLQAANAGAAYQPATDLILATVQLSLDPAATTMPAGAAESLATSQHLASQELLAMTTVKNSTLAAIAGTVLIAAGLAGSGLETGGNAHAASPAYTVALMAADDSPPAQSGDPSTVLAGDNPELAASRLLKALNRPTTLSFRDTPLSKVLSEISANANIDIVVENQSLSNAGVSLDEPITVELSGITLSSALKLILSPLHLRTVADQQVLRITHDVWNDPRYQASDYKATNPNYSRIREALHKKVDFEFIDTELQQVVSFLSDRYQIPIVFDEPAFTEFGVGQDTPINLVIGGVTLESALNQILRTHDLDYIERDEVLAITSRDAAEEFMETRVYQLSQLPANFRPEDVARVICRTVRPGSWGENPWVYIVPTPKASAEGEDEYGGGYESYESGGLAGGAEYGAGGGMLGYGSERKPVPENKTLAAIETLPGCLVITHCQRAHREIAELLDQLRRMPAVPGPFGGPAQPSASLVPAVEPDSDPIVEVSSMFGQYLGREPRDNELASWRTYFARGGSLGGAQVYLLSLPEYYHPSNRFASATDNPRLVQKLHQHILHRDATEPELAFWDQRLSAAGGSRFAFVSEFLASTQSR